jgi:alpha-galactosidase
MFIFFLLTLTFALNNGLGRTPAMGWNSWNKYGCSINETIIKSITDSIISKNLDKLGYKYVVIDDCWQAKRTNFGQIRADPRKFPSGIKALADYVHERGLLFGIYSSSGTLTCQGRPGSLGYEDIDARQYAEWGVDFVKYGKADSLCR